MRYKFILFLLLTLKSISIFSQENTNYWYNGIAYTDSTKLTSGVPYLTIALTKEGEQMPKAITVSNSLGAFLSMEFLWIYLRIIPFGYRRKFRSCKLFM